MLFSTTLVFTQKSIDLNKNGKIDLYEDQNEDLDKRAEHLLSLLTLEEKASLTVGLGMNLSGLPNGPKKDKVPGAAGQTFAIERLGIANLILSDGPAGVRIEPQRAGIENKTFYCTAFPIATTVASTWDTALAFEIGKAMGNELKEYGADVLLAPALNIHRNPRNGRNFEYFSEDPLLSGKMAAAVVNGTESNGVGTSIKHFVANNQETNRMLVNTIVSERALREIYLKGFEIAVKEAQPWTVMSSYNKLNGPYTSQNKELLTSILRDEWGFEGLVMTDWFAGDDVLENMIAGNDLIMPGNPDQLKTILDALKNGKLSEEVINTNVKRILKIALQSPSVNGYEYSDDPDLKSNAIVARQVASEGIILLKNEDNTLPIPNSQKVAAFGIGSYEFIAGGTGSGDVNEAYTVSLVEGLSNASVQLDDGIQETYVAYMEEAKAKMPEKQFFFIPDPPIDEMEVSDVLLNEAIQQNDIAFITIGRLSGEFTDRNIEDDIYLKEGEIAMMKKVSEGFRKAGKKVVVLLNIGNIIEMESWKDLADAIVLPWQGGQEAGNALADVLLGKVNPSGKLPTTIPVNYSDVKSAENFPGTNNPNAKEQFFLGGMISKGFDSEVIYEEGIYVGYRYFSTFDLKTSYPFGFGMSYTNFSYNDLKLSDNNLKEKIEISIKVTNMGKVAGKEVVQLYVTAPTGFLDKPTIELKGFAKTKLLAPGESQNLKFSLTPDQLASFNEQKSAWITDAGNYIVKVGASSEDIKAIDQFSILEEVVVQKVHPVLKPNVKINELTGAKSW